MYTRCSLRKRADPYSVTRRVHDCARRAQGSPSPECRVLFATVCAPAPDSLSPLRLAFFLSPRFLTPDDVSVSVASRFWRVCSSHLRSLVSDDQVPGKPEPGSQWLPDALWSPLLAASSGHGSHVLLHVSVSDL